jgi:hypothetical protein
MMLIWAKRLSAAMVMVTRMKVRVAFSPGQVT